MSIRAVYIIKNSLSEKCYIGSTSDFYRRKGDHLNKLRKNRHHSILLQRAFNKYGEGAFEFEIIEVVNSTDELISKEQEYLDVLKPAYNVSRTANHPPGLMGRKLTEIHKKRISEANKGKKNCLGHHHSQESKDLMRLHHNKKSNAPRSDEFRKDLSERFKKWHASLTEEQKKERAEKVSKAQSIIKETECVICHKKIVYHSQGKFIPKTCSPECLKELWRNILSDRKQRHPERFCINHWAGKTEEQRKGFFKDKILPPVVKSICIICRKEFEHSRKKRPKTCSPECLSVALSKHSYNRINLEPTSNIKVRALCEFIKKYNRMPHHRSKDKEEAKLGGILGGKRQGKAGRGTVVFYPSDQEIAESFGYPDLFELDDPETNSNTTCKKVCEWMKQHGKKPSVCSKNKEENRLAGWIHSKRKAYKGQSSGRFFLSGQAIVESYGFPDIFNK